MIAIYDHWGWVDVNTPQIVRVGNMHRGYVRECLQWCMAHQHERFRWTYSDGTWGETAIIKDQHTYQEWINVFFLKLLDPNLPE